jgi:type II secretion system protein C
MVNPKEKFYSLFNWLMIGLIVFLWLQFFISPNDDIDIQTSKATTSYNSPHFSNTSIEQYHIFGSQGQLIDIPLNQGNTSLDLVLNGTMSNLDAKTGMAYISNIQGKQEVFKVGDKIFNVATLKEIYKDYIVLDHNGRNERLSLSEKIQGMDVVSNKNQAKNKSTPPAYLKHLQGNQTRNWQELMDQQKYDANKISKIVSNINIVTDQVGKIQGLRVSNLASGDLLSKNGLKSNDIITAINGQKVSAANMMTIQQTLKQNPNATITIKRNGQLKNIQVNLNQ